MAFFIISNKIELLFFISIIQKKNDNSPSKDSK